MYYRLVVCALLVFVNNVNSARILGVFPLPSLSHQYVFQAYAKELARLGHELVIITPNTIYSDGTNNITEIDISETFEKFRTIMEEGESKKIYRRGVIQDSSPENLAELYIFITHLLSEEFKTPAVQKLIESREHFDLVVIEAFLEYSLVFSHIFKAPTILISSFYGFPEYYDAVGAPARHPIFYPHLQRSYFKHHTFWDRIRETVLEIRLKISEIIVINFQNKALKDDFGPETPSIGELQKNIDLLFLNANTMIANNRPVPPNVVYLGGLHLQPVKELPKDLKQYLDNSPQGVVYCSLGSNVKPSNMDNELLNAFIDAFKKLPYNILWKFDGDDLKDLPKNVKIQKWFPQRDLLGHPNIKAFITQGGLQSFDEAIDFAVPLVGIPMMNDQWYNVNKFVELGVAIELDGMTMNAEDIVNAVETVIENKSYRKSMEKLRTIWYDQPQKPLERAIWWTDYVLRHGGARHLRASAANVSWTQYWMVDVVTMILAVLLLSVVLVFVLVKRLLKLCRRRSKVKVN